MVSKILERTSSTFYKEREINDIENTYGQTELTKLVVAINSIFIEWHNDRYLRQCLYNLQEKADCGGVSKEEWARITDHFVVMS